MTTSPADHDSTVPGPCVDPPSARLRWLIGAGIVVFLLSQILIPLSYYWRGEPTSERFAWRMFSSVDLSKWETQVVAVIEQKNGELLEQTMPLTSLLQASHVRSVERAQLDIVEPYLRKLAAEPGVREVRFLAQGTFPSGKLMEPIQLTLKAGELTRVR